MRPTEIIGQILARKRLEIDLLKASYSYEQLAQSASQVSPTRGFRNCLTNKKPLAVIAELKKSSPSKGLLKADFEPVTLAIQYEQAGASAISVLTEQHFFLGSPDYLKQVRQHVSLPLLRKDFLLHPLQIPESRALGADAVLLIAAFLQKDLLADMMHHVREFQMDALVEVHDECELDIALELGADLIGINNRNLKTFEVDLETSFRLKSRIESSSIVVAESGIRSYGEVQRLAAAGINAILVGESLVRSNDVAGKMKELLGSLT